MHEVQTNEDFNYLINKVKDKLARWKINSLSMAGRLTLAKASIVSIPYFYMQAARIPIGVCNHIEKMGEKIVWVHNDTHRKIHNVASQTCYKRRVKVVWA